MKEGLIEGLSQLESLYDHPGFSIFWKALQAKTEYARTKALAIDVTDPTVNQTACYRKGLLDSLMEVERMKQGLIDDFRTEIARK